MDVPLDPVMAMAARIHRRVDGPLGSGAAPRVARTDAAGAFAFAGLAVELLADRALMLSAEVPDHEVRLRDDVRIDPPFRCDGGRVALVAFPVGEARLRPLMPDGAEAWGGLDFDVRPRPSNAARELERGRLLRLEPGRYEARASIEAGPRRLRSEWTAFEVEVGCCVDVPLPLAARSGVIARVTVPEAIPEGAEPGARLLLVEAGPLPSPEEVARRGSEPDRMRRWRDSAEVHAGERRFFLEPSEASPPVLARTFEFLDREPGRYALVVGWGGVPSGPARLVTLEGETVEVALPLPALEEAPLVHVRAIGPDGAPVRASWTGPGVDRRAHASEVRLPPPEGLAPGEPWLGVDADRLGLRLVPAPAPGVRAVDVRFEATGAVRVRVAGPGGLPDIAGGWHVLLRASAAGGDVPRDAITRVWFDRRAESVVEVSNVQPGDYDVALEAPTQEIVIRMPLGHAAVRVVSGVTAEVAIEAAPLHEVRVTTARACGVAVRMVADADAFRWRVDLAPGAGARPRLVAGEWEIDWEVDADRLGGSDGPLVGRRRFRVPETTSIALEGP